MAVSRSSQDSPAGVPPPSCPILFLDDWAQQLTVRLARRAGRSGSRMRDNTIEGFLREHGVTVVLGEFLDQFAEFVPLLDRMRLPYVVQGHGFDLSVALRDPEMVRRYAVYKSARAVLTRCEFHRRRLIDFGLPRSVVHVNFGGVDVPDELPRRAPNASKRFIAVSYMVEKKGAIYLLEAFRIASTQDREITLDVVGGGPFLPAVRQFVHACDMSSRVTVHGIVSEERLRHLRGSCGVFVQHSITSPETGDEEGLPASIQEAMAQGLAVVSTRHAGIPEAVEDGVSGFLVEEGDVKAMASAMLRASQCAPALGNAGYERARISHSWSDEKARLTKWLGEGAQSSFRTGPSRGYPSHSRS